MYRSNSQIQFNNNANYWTGHGKNTYVGDKVVEIRDEEEQYQADKKRWELNNPNKIYVSGSADENLEGLLRVKEQDYQDNYRPLGEAMNASSVHRFDEGGQDLEKIAKAGALATNTPEHQARVGDRARRQMDRHNAYRDALTEREGNYERAVSLKRSGIHEVNQARINQFERNSRVRDTMINVGRGLETSSLSNLTNAASAETARENQNEQIQAANRQAKMQTAASIAMMAIMLA